DQREKIFGDTYGDRSKQSEDQKLKDQQSIIRERLVSSMSMLKEDLRSIEPTELSDNSKSKIKVGDKVIFDWQPDMSSRLQEFDGRVVEVKFISESGKYIDWYVPGSDKT